jgi:hypothetical protein
MRVLALARAVRPAASRHRTGWGESLGWRNRYLRSGKCARKKKTKPLKIGAIMGKSAVEITELTVTSLTKEG